MGIQHPVPSESGQQLTEQNNRTSLYCSAMTTWILHRINLLSFAFPANIASDARWERTIASIRNEKLLSVVYVFLLLALMLCDWVTARQPSCT